MKVLFLNVNMQMLTNLLSMCFACTSPISSSIALLQLKRDVRLVILCNGSHCLLIILSTTSGLETRLLLKKSYLNWRQGHFKLSVSIFTAVHVILPNLIAYYPKLCGRLGVWKNAMYCMIFIKMWTAARGSCHVCPEACLFAFQNQQIMLNTF